MTARGDPARATRVSYAVNVIGPVGLYLLLHGAFHLGNLVSLLAGVAVAAAATGYTTLRRGRPDPIGLLVLIELAASVVLVLLTHDPRVLLFKPAVLIGLAGLYLLVTCVRGRAAAYQTTVPALARNDPRLVETCETLWEISPPFRRRLRIMTAAWGVAFLLDAAVRVYYALTSSVTTAFVLPHLIDAGLLAIAIAVIQFRHLKAIVRSPAVAGKGERA